MGMVFAVYLWKNRRTSKYKDHEKGVFRISTFQETIRRLQSLQSPQNINTQTTEEYYLKLSHICRAFIREEYFIRATEMTSDELEIYFQSININHELINAWSAANKIVDKAKYAGQIPKIDQFIRDKEEFIHIIKSLYKSKKKISN